jgi:pimeloyl-ACP methyl ester carboxylesterase
MADSRTLDLGGQVHVMDHGGTGQPILLIHGLGGSHVNWSAVADSLAEEGAVTAIDLIGFGRTPPDGRTAAVEEQVDLVVRYLAAHHDEPAILVGNSMGGLVSMLVAQEAPELVRSLVLVDPALPMIRPTFDLDVAKALVAPLFAPFGRKRAEMAAAHPEQYVQEVFSVVCADPSRVAPEDWAKAVEMAKERAEMPWVAKSFGQAASSLFSILARRWSFTNGVRSIDADALVIHGDKDRLVHVASARWLCRSVRPDWTLVELDGVGHTPQMETPDRFLAAVLPFVTSSRSEATT